jgi:two-component system, OmpR family, sensor kinase
MPGNDSLQARLNQQLLLLMALFALFASGLSAWLSFVEARDVQDDLLRQVAHLLAAGMEQGASFADQVSINGDEDELRIRHWSPAADVASSAPVMPDGLQQHRIDGNEWRLYRLHLANGDGLEVGQRLEVRNEMAVQGCLQSLLPILLLGPLVLLLTRWVIGRSFAPLRETAVRLEQCSMSSPATPGDQGLPLPQQVPIEVAPFVVAVDQLVRHLHQVLLRQQRFIADAAHELRTPVSALVVLLDNLGHAHDLQTIQQRLPPLQQAAVRIRQLLHQLLDLARLQEGGGLQAQPTEVRALVIEVLEDLWPLAESRQIDLGMGQADDIVVDTDPRMLKHILSNAVDNAIRYSPPGSLVTLSLIADQQAFRLLVEDNGPGITETELQRVMEPFVRGENSCSQTSGTGLGLAIAEEAATQLGGTITLSNQASGGLLFCYRAPL